MTTTGSATTIAGDVGVLDEHRHSGSTVVVHARTRRPSASATQQSWHAPIQQKPARSPGRTRTF
jgi:hypothetical protein